MCSITQISCLIGLAILGGSSACMAQYDGSQPSVSPVPPDQAALFKPMDRPAGTSSGILPVKIPLFTTGPASLEIPVSLNYNGGGIKVEEIAGCAGLGWNLSAGGSITRVMNDLPDDSQYGYLEYSFKPPDFNNYIGSDTSYVIFQSVVQGHLDMQPDIFYFSCNGLSGRFFFDTLGNAIIDAPSGVTIKPIYQTAFDATRIMGWILTDTHGAKYYFGLNKAQNIRAIDYNGVSYSSLNGYTNTPFSQSYVATWYLLEMDDMNQENQVRFRYDSAVTNFEIRSGSYMKLQAVNTSACTANDYDGDETYATTTSQEQYVHSIASSRDSVVFYHSLRLDNGMEVDSIKQFDHGGNMQQLYHFNYSYFTAPNLLNLPAGQTYNSRLKRLELLSLSSFGNSETDSLSYDFDYYTTYNLPDRMSRGQDYWGYYNGQDGNWTLLPNGAYSFWGTTVRETTLGERRVAFPYSMANTLTTIHYPTGGYRQFVYESNQALYSTTSEITPDNTYYQYWDINTTSFNTTIPTQPTYQQYFDVNSTDGGTTFSYYIDGYLATGTCSVELLDSATRSVLYSANNQYSGNFDIPNGHYSLVFNFSGETLNSLEATWATLALNTTQMGRFDEAFYEDNMNVGGIRVKQVNDYDPLSGQTTSTYYQYNLFSDSALSSGLVVSSPWVAAVGGCSTRACDLIRLSSQSCYPLSAQEGSYVVYTDVRTYQQGNGRTDRNYSFDFDGSVDDNPTDFPYVPLNQAWRRGLLTNEKTYDNNNNLLESDSTVYPYINDIYQYDPNGGLFLILHKQILGYKMVGYADGTGCYEPYNITSQVEEPESVFRSVYSGSGVQQFRTDYAYDDSLNMPQLNYQTDYLANNLTKVTTYRYPFDTASRFLFGLTPAEVTLKDSLLVRNDLVPLETSVQTQSVFGGGSKMVYGVFNNAAYHPAHTKTYTSLTDTTNVYFTAYDSSGGPAAENKNYDVNTTWLWGYNHTCPVAKVVGASYATALSYVNNAVLQNPSSDSALRTELNKIRTGLAGTTALVTTYTYSPLLGITSLTDPSGKVVYYQYDDHGRLSVVLDQYNNVVKVYNYIFTNPQAP